MATKDIYRVRRAAETAVRAHNIQNEEIAMISSLEPSICPFSWKSYQENVREALDIIRDSALPDETKEKIYELIEVEDFMGFPVPDGKVGPSLKTWDDALKNSGVLIPEQASVPEADLFVDTLRQLSRGGV